VALSPPERVQSARVGAPARRPSLRLRRLRRALTPYLFCLPVVLFIGGLLLYPVVLNVEMSFQSRTLENLISGPADWLGTANYRAIFHDPAFRDAALHSVEYACISVAVQFAIALPLALFFARRFPGARVMRSLFLVAYAIPVVVSAQVFKWMLDGRGVLNWALHGLHLQGQPVYWLSDIHHALPALIAVQVWLGVPFTLVNLLAGLTTIPSDLKEAAAIDGAGPLGRFRYVTWPLLRPAALAAVILSLIFAFKTFDLVWIATKGGPGTSTEILPTLAYRTAFVDFQFGRAAAILNVIFVACVVLALLYLSSLRREARPA
jgi:multiple sugar transport system permease protein